MLISNAIMLAITVFLAVVLFAGASVHDDGQYFFDMNNSNALRGFWCLIVILVHIPQAHQNRIQDMIGSFAYIGVTFFFMTSAYGLKMQMSKNPSVIKTFWRKRLPKLLVPSFTVNIISVIVTIITGGEITIVDLFSINGWVMWLLICYIFFWISYRFVGRENKDWVVVLLICTFSVVMYILKMHGSTRIVWCTEIFGFIWGLCLADMKDTVLRFAKEKWIQKVVALWCVSCLCGLSYLRFKSEIFWGDYLLKIALGFLLLFLLLLFNSRICFNNRISNFLGWISFEVYLTHHLVFRVLDITLPSMNSGVFIALSLLTTIVLATVEKYINQSVLTTVDRIIFVK